MIINGFEFGQLGNRLFLTSQLIVLAKDTDSTLIDYSFNTYKKYFKNIQDKDFIIYPESKRNLLTTFVFKHFEKKVPHVRDFLIHRQISSKYLGFINQHQLNITNYDEYINDKKQYHNFIIQGWLKLDITPLHKYRSELLRFFTPLDEHVANISVLIKEARKDSDILIGIHIRRGDYKEWKGGIYFFDDSIYAKLMRNLQEHFSGKKVKFLICSNEDIDFNCYKEFNSIRATNHIVEDMYALAECDYIAGPFSTYSLWPAFIKEKPLYRMLDKNMEFDPNHFITVNDRSVHN